MDFLRTRSAYCPASSLQSEPLYQFNRLELAPQGWQPLIEMMAKGYVETIGMHDYCQECGGIIQGATGHRFDCSTMLARRLLTNLPLLLLRHSAEAPGVDFHRDHVKRVGQTASDASK
ncbi:hypothetical protein [Massilia sp. TWP1-3-3]|uniref:hypothetical protein n=1 Tax=Massilia sp. TWP1-3-3 TaxID=2804573 RepID=UPI003CEF0A13